MFSDLRANYDCITDGVATSPCDLTSTGATTQVVHFGGTGADGTDTIRNIERLQFADVVAATCADDGDRGGRRRPGRPSAGSVPPDR